MWVPTQIDSLHGVVAVTGVCGENYSAVLTDHGEIYSWGDGELGKLGHGSNITCQYYPRKIENLLPMKCISAGMQHMAVITSQGKIFTWGGGFFGRLGHTATENCYHPKEIQSVSKKAFVVVSCGSYHTVAIEDTGFVFIWGRAKMNCQFQDSNEPQKIMDLENRKFKQVVAGDGHTLALSQDGEIFSWGSNKYGKLGIGKKTDKYHVHPLKIMGLPINILSVATNFNHSLAVTESGDLYSWGSGGGGRLGQNSTKLLRKPKHIQVKWSIANADDEGVNDYRIFEYIYEKVKSGGQVSIFREMMLLL